MALDKLTKVQSVGISSFIQVVGVVTATQGFDGNITGIITATGDFSIADKIVHTGDTNTALRFPAADTFTVETGGGERVRVDSAGRLLLGTTDAGGNNTANHLVVSNNAGANDQAGMTIRGGTSGRSQIFFSDGNSGQDEYRGMLRYDHQDNSMQFRTNAVEKLRITSAGDMGLGTASPRSITNFGSFAINGTAGAFTDYFLNGTRTGTTAVDSNGFTSEAVGSSTPFRVITNGTEKLRIRSDGKISTGTNLNATNSYEFSITGADGTGAFYAHGRNHYLSNRSNAYSSLTLKKANADSDGIDYLQLRDSSNALKGQITGAGNWKPISGGGIDFSAFGNAGGMTSELLDDYEEGVFTATCANSVTLHSTVDLCQYVKIGSLVTVMGQIRVNNSNSNSDLTINNLPFTVFSAGEGSAYAVGAVRLYNADMSSLDKYVICLADGGTTNLTFQGVRDNGASVPLSATGDGYYMFSLTYRTST